MITKRRAIASPPIASSRGSCVLLQVEAAAEQSKQADDDQMDGNDVVEQPGHNGNEYAGSQLPPAKPVA
jgi:hypothetical protein